MIRSISAAAVLGAALVLGAPLPPLPVNDSMPWTLLRWIATLLLLLTPALITCRRASVADRCRTRASVLLIAALCGATLAVAQTGQRVQTRWPESLAGVERHVTGRIATPVQAVAGTGRAADAQRFDLVVDSMSCPDEPADCTLPGRLPTRIRVVDWRAIQARGDVARYRAGERRRFSLKLDPPDGRLNRGGFDRERWLFLERIDASASVRGIDASPIAAARIGATGAIGRLRERMAAAVQDLPTANAQIVLVQALTLGMRSSLSAVWQERLQASGTAHLVAISGLHVGLVFALVLALCAGLSRVWRYAGDVLLSEDWIDARREQALEHTGARIRAGRAAALVRPDMLALLAAACYAAMAGFALPAQRALVMLGVAVLVRHRRRVVAPGTTLAMAALVVLVFDPVAPLASGFWLSVGAVAALIWLQSGRIAATSGAWKRAGVVTRLQLWLGLLMLPVTAWSFQQASLVSPLANLVAIPWVGLVTVPSALLATACAPIDALQPLAAALLWIAQASLQGLAYALDLALRLPGASVRTALPDPSAMWLALAAVLVATLPNAWRPRAALLSLAPLLLLPALLHITLGRRVDGMELHVLDVGHGLAALILTEQSTVLFDTGGGSAGATRLERDVMPYLRAIGRPSVDRLVLSHLDGDHSAGLVPLRRLFPDLPVISAQVEATQSRLALAGLPVMPPVQACVAGQGFELDGVRFDMLSPAAHDRGSDNDRSCVLLVSTGAGRILLTGDIEAGAEARLARRVGQLPVDVLVAPHHGSKTSSTPNFVAMFPARHVVFAADRRSRWGFPHAVVRMRYKQSRARMLVTGHTGSLVFGFDSGSAWRKVSPVGGQAPVAWRDTARRLWRPVPLLHTDV